MKARSHTIASCRKLEFKMAAKNTRFTHNSTKIVMIVMVLISIKKKHKTLHIGYLIDAEFKNCEKQVLTQYLPAGN